ncbi:hypothetical protein TNCV_4175531 [Trichonephila clavipes]|nr:hypothetical protein TNCV_4175531 [Trichonephila clavipes]
MKKDYDRLDKRNSVGVFIHLKGDINSNSLLKCGARSAPPSLQIRVTLNVCGKVLVKGRKKISGAHVALLRGQTGALLWQKFERQLVAQRHNESVTLRLAQSPVVSVPLRRQWCQVRDHWMAEWRSVGFSNESKFCLDRVFGQKVAREMPATKLYAA